MAEAEPKKFSVRLAMDVYKIFHAKADELGYDDMTFGDILLSYALPRWDGAVDQRVQEVKARERANAPEPARKGSG